MKLITDNAMLQQFAPNMLQTVGGETPLFDKIAVHLEAAESWAQQYITSEDVMNDVAALPADNALRRRLSEMVVADAFARAIPSLDIVFTPNGFAVAQTSNLAPASKQRVDRLIGSMQTLRFNSMRFALDLLPWAEGWCDTPQAQSFGQTLFPNIDLAQLVPSADKDQWTNYCSLQLSAGAFELTLSEEYFSREQMEVWRDRSLRRTLTNADMRIVSPIRLQIVECLRDRPINARRMVDLVNLIRTSPSDFPEWHSSATAVLFTPPKFENKKKSSGYFF